MASYNVVYGLRDRKLVDWVKFPALFFNYPINKRGNMELKKIVADKYVLTAGDQKILLTKEEMDELLILIQEIND